jgi:hypothetical protein
MEKEESRAVSGQESTRAEQQGENGMETSTHHIRLGVRVALVVAGSGLALGCLSGGDCTELGVGHVWVFASNVVNERDHPQDAMYARAHKVEVDAEISVT